MAKARQADFIVLLVDSEDPVAEQSTWQHLHSWDGWERPADATDDNAHLMVQVMESWFLADLDSLTEYYGQGFNKNPLPDNPNIEDIPKSAIMDGLASATRQCKRKRKGSYSKGGHSFDILASIDPSKVINASPHASNLIGTLKAKAGQSG